MRVPASARTLLRAPGYSALAILTLALSVGANLVVFTLVNALWLRPPPVADPDRVVVISTLVVTADVINDMVRRDRLERMRELPVFEAVAGQVSPSGPMGDFRPRLVLEAVGREVEALGVTAEYFTTLGVPVRGRDFTADDDRSDAEPGVIISDRLWRAVFEGRADVIGSRAQTSAGPVPILGVAPRGFHGARRGEDVDLWVPSRQVLRLAPSWRLPEFAAEIDFITNMAPFVGLARLRPGTTMSQAAEAVRAVDPRNRYVVIPLADIFTSPGYPGAVLNEGLVLRVIGVTAGLVLIAGCTTLAALVLVHYERRRRELAVRLALGGSRRRLAARLAGELGWLTIIGVACALLTATWAIASLPALRLPGGLPLDRLDLSLDPPSVAAAITVAVLAMLAAGLLPLLRFTRPTLAASLTTSASTGSRGSLLFRRVLLATHAASTLVVLVAAGLFVQTMAYGFSRGAGFDVDHTLFVSVQPGMTEFIDRREGPEQSGMTARRRAAYERMLADLSALPGARAVAIGSGPVWPRPGEPSGPMVLRIDGVEREHRVGFSTGGAGYAGALGLSILAGRDFIATDADGSSVLVTRSLGGALWGAATAVGRRFERVGRVTRSFDVVGVVEDFVQGSMQHDLRAGVVQLRTIDDALRGVQLGIAMGTWEPSDTLKPQVISAATRIFPSASTLRVESGRELIARDLGRQRLGAWFFSGFGLVALVIGLAGVFGLVAYLAESRRREIGVRMALGATPGALVRGAVGTGLLPVAIGTFAGLGSAALLARAVASLLIGIGPLDVFTYLGGGALMLTSALGAGLVAALRIRRISPMDALRAE